MLKLSLSHTWPKWFVSCGNVADKKSVSVRVSPAWNSLTDLLQSGENYHTNIIQERKANNFTTDVSKRNHHINDCSILDLVHQQQQLSRLLKERENTELNLSEQYFTVKFQGLFPLGSNISAFYPTNTPTCEDNEERLNVETVESESTVVSSLFEFGPKCADKLPDKSSPIVPETTPADLPSHKELTPEESPEITPPEFPPSREPLFPLEEPILPPGRREVPPEYPPLFPPQRPPPEVPYPGTPPPSPSPEVPWPPFHPPSPPEIPPIGPVQPEIPEF